MESEYERMPVIFLHDQGCELAFTAFNYQAAGGEDQDNLDWT
jgi:hypothetical protein